jgi:transposase
MKPIKLLTVKTVLCLLEQPKSIRQIAAEIGISKTLVQNISRTLAPTRTKIKAGRPWKFDYRHIFYIWLLIYCSIIDTAIQAIRRYNDENEDPVLANTVCRALRDIGLKAKRRVKKPRLTKSQKKACLDFALDHKNWMEADWRQVIWSDESKINRISSDGMRYMWIESDKESKVKAGNVDPNLIMLIVKHGSGSIMV